MKDVFEFNHIDKSLSESDVKTLEDFYKHYHKNTGVSGNHIRGIKFLMKHLLCLV